MAKIKLTTVPFKGTPEQEKKLREELLKLKSTEGALMPALQIAQDIYGYLPIQVQKIVGEVLNIPLEEIFGVSTFYSQFSLNPKGKYAVNVCMGTACYVKGAAQVLDKIKSVLKIGNGECTADGKFMLVETRCVGCCGLAPVVMINEDVYGKVTVDQVEAILAKY